MKFFHCVLRWSRPVCVAHLIATFSLALLAASVASAQIVDISTGPLYAGATPSPNVVISASIEFPTAGQAYICSSANSPVPPNCVGYSANGASIYSGANTYTGFFDSTKCYVYVSSSPVTSLFPDSNNSAIANNEGDPNGYFAVQTGPTSIAGANHGCGAFPLFSGNALNWATMGSLDEFRYALTGGNRVNESGPSGGTIVQRAYLTGCTTLGAPDGNCSLGDSAVPGVPDFYASDGLFPTLSLPGNTFSNAGSTLYINNCKTFMYLSTSNNGSSGNCTKPATDEGVYNIRVNVCDSAEGPTRPDLCLQYGGTSGKYKPVGTVQRNAAKMRFAIFGYLVDRSLPASELAPAYTVPSNCRDNIFLNDPWNRCRVGGVLRAPMKYVGPTTYDANGVATNNVNAEINADGTLVDDPEHNAATFGGKYSGFINYLNRFGTVRQVSPPAGSLGGAGEYKRYDTMGEMYYEAIRYFQYRNLPPTPETYQGIYPNQVAGYFPVLSSTNWPADPIVAQCAANYIINIGDTDTWDDSYLPGYRGSPAPLGGSGDPSGPIRLSSRPVAGGLDAYEWTRRIGVLEAGTPSLVPNDVRPQMFPYNDRNPLSASTAIAATQIQDTVTGSFDTATYLVAGAAYWANTNEIRPDLPALGGGKIHSIKTISVDSGGQTRPVWDRQLYLMGKYGGFNVPTISRSDGTGANPFYATNPVNPGGAGIRSNAEWADSSGMPANYLRASSPQKLIAGLQSAFASIGANSGTAAGGAVTSANLNYGAAGTYISQFSSARWSGTVLYETVSSIGGVFTVGTTPIWDAGMLLTTRCGVTPPFSTVCTDTDASTSKRNIVTTITSAGGVRSAIDFAFNNLASDLNYTRALNVNSDTGVLDGRGQQRVNYLRGYRADESSAVSFRTRDSVAGDIVNSAPIYVGAPATGITDAAYQAFYAANIGRTPAVYTGANDGMLHAFNASNTTAGGSELFAYIPGFVSSYLGDLTSTNYAHDPFVDAIPTVQEAKVNGSYKTVLVSGVGGGGQGVFALDVTNPTAFGPANVLFEFSDADDADLGNVLFAPQIVKLQTGTTSLGGVTSPTYGYFAAVTGYNNRRPVCKSPGNANLLTTLLSPAQLNSTPACTSNSQADAYVSTDTTNRGVLFLLSLDRTVGTPWVRNGNYYKFYFPAISASSRNGLGAVSALPSSAGDGAAAALYFGDLQGQLWRLNTIGSPSAWTPSRGSVASPLPLFVASPSTNVYQPITARPELASGPYGSTLVIFGTGAYFGQSDLSTPYAAQSQYALIDTNGGTLITRSTDLQQRTAEVSRTQVSVTGSAFTYSGPSSKKGWYIDFPSSTSQGERMVNKAAVAPGLLTFTSLTLAGSLCGSGGGYVYQVNPLSGLPLAGSIGGYTSTVGIPGPPVIVDLTVTAGQSRGTGEQINKKTQTTLVSGTSGGIAGIGTPPATKAPPVGRISWREITNYNDRH